MPYLHPKESVMIQLEKKHARYKKHHEFVAVAIVAPARVLCVQRLVLPSTKMIHYRKIGLVARRPSRSLEFPYQNASRNPRIPAGARVTEHGCRAVHSPTPSVMPVKRRWKRRTARTGEM